MTPRDPNSKITIRPAPADPGGAPPRRPAPRRSRPPVYQYYLQDHPVLIPVGTLLLGGVCLYLTIFSHLLQDLIVGAGGAGPTLTSYNTMMSWLVAFVLGAMVLSGIFLLVSLIALGIRGLRRRPAVCSRCQATEQGRRRRFAHAPVGGTEWEEVTCPACGHAWYARL